MLLSDRASDVGTGERIQHEIVWVGQELDEELRNFSGKARWVRTEAPRLAGFEVTPIVAGVRDREHIRRDGTAVVLGEPFSHDVPRRTSPSVVLFCGDEALHRIRVLTKHLPVVR